MQTVPYCGQDLSAIVPSVVDMTTTVIHTESLTRHFTVKKQTVEAVRSLDLEVADGELVALLGPNGAGKSTTIDMLLGLLPPDAGTVSLFGRPPAEAVAAGGLSLIHI